MRYLCHKLVCICALLTLGAVTSPARADNTELPAWQTLEFEQRALWATAKSSIELVAAPQHPGQWLLNANSSVVSNSEEVQLRLLAANGQLVSRSRLSRGKNQRLKTYDYRPQYILRERRAPGPDPEQAAALWPLQSTRELAYPDDLGSKVLTDAYALLLIAQRFSDTQTNSQQVAVHTDLNFYQVTLSRGQDIAIEVNYQLAGNGQVDGTRNARVIKLKVTALGQARDKADFRLLGLNGDIELLFDIESGLLLQLRGSAPRIGSTRINLKSATLRESTI
jgi:hypothetical protein